MLLANLTTSGTTLSSFNYTYNPVGNRTQIVESNGDVVSLAYDPTYQLTNERRSGANSYNLSYTYDSVGNRTLLSNGGAVTTNTYNAGNELITSQASSGLTTSSYDGNGNLLTSLAPGAEWTTNTWDGENRLTQVALPSGIVDSFTFNGDGQRVQKIDSASTANHVWDGQNILLETNASNIIQVVYTLEPLVYGNLISQSRGGVYSVYLFDAIGSTRQLVGSTGSLTDSYSYDSFGNTVIASGSTVNALRYIGRIGYYFDADLLTYYARARTYIPLIARWLSRDFSPFEESYLSLYCYVRNNPANLADPSGRQAALPAPTQQQQKECVAACAAARANPGDYRITNKTAGFVLCMPASSSSPAGQLFCACVGTPVLNEYPSVKKCILAHEVAHVTNGDEVCDPNCPAPYRTFDHLPGYNRTASECRAAAAEIVCLGKALGSAKGYKEINRILFHIQRERDYCKGLGGNVDPYLPPGGI